MPVQTPACLSDCFPPLPLLLILIDFLFWFRFSVANTSGNGTSFTLDLSGSAVSIDRMMIKENQYYGQRIRQYLVQYMLKGESSWVTWFSGSSVGRTYFVDFPTEVITANTSFTSGNKRIQADQQTVLSNVQSVQLVISEAIAEPVLLDFSVYAPCPWS